MASVAANDRVLIDFSNHFLQALLVLRYNADHSTDQVLASVITQASPNTPVIMTTPPEAESTKTGPTVVDTTAPAAQTTTTDTKTPASASLSSTAESSKATVESSTLAAVPVSTVPKQQPAPSSTNDRQIASAGTTRPAQTDAQANRAITNAPRTSPSRKPKAAPKKKSGFAKFFAACLPCGAAAAYEDESHDQKPSTSRQTDVKPQPSTTSPTSTEKQTVAPTTNDEKAAIASADSTPLATQPTSDAQLATVAATANASPEGVTLPPEETAGMTSGAVMAPGKEATGSTTVPKARRRRSGKGGGTAGIITSVPEPGAESTESSSDSSDDDDDEDDDIEDDEDEEQALIARGGVGIPIGEVSFSTSCSTERFTDGVRANQDGLPHPLLAELAADMQGRKCLVLDLDETLVHSSFKMVQQADYVVPVEIESQYHNVFVIKRPGVDGSLLSFVLTLSAKC